MFKTMLMVRADTQHTPSRGIYAANLDRLIPGPRNCMSRCRWPLAWGNHPTCRPLRLPACY